MNIAFNTLKFVRHLKQAGLSGKQAEALAEAHTEAFTEILETQLATTRKMPLNSRNSLWPRLLN